MGGDGVGAMGDAMGGAMKVMWEIWGRWADCNAINARR